MSTNEKIEIKEAVDSLGLEVKRKDGLSNIEIRGALVYKGLVLKTRNVDGSYRTMVLSREQSEQLIEQMQLGLEVSRAEEERLKKKRVIDFRVAGEMNYLLKDLVKKGKITIFRQVAYSYFDSVVSDQTFDAIREALAYKKGWEVSRIGYTELTDELLFQYV